MFYASTGGNANAGGRTGKLLFFASHYAELDNFKFANPRSRLLAAYSCHVIIRLSEFRLIPLPPLTLAGEVMKLVCYLTKYTVL